MAYIDDVYSVVQIQPTGLEAFVRLSQNENGRRLYFAINGGEIPTGSTATLSGTKPDGVVYSKTGTISGNVVTILEDVQLTAAAGPWPAKLRILNGGNVVATGRIRFVIDKDPVAAGAVPSDSQLEGLVAEAAAYAEAAKDGAYYGSPLTASTVAGMTDTNRVYVYTGSESGYTAGNWYYYNGSAWTSGGVYNSQGIQTDTTLSVIGMAADAKVVGDEIADLKDDLDSIENAVFPDINYGCTLSNGTLVNPSNANAVNTSSIPCMLGDVIQMMPGRVNTSGYYYQYAYRVYNATGEVIKDVSSASDENNLIIIDDVRSASVRFALFEYNGASYNPLRENTYGGSPYAVVRRETDRIDVVIEGLSDYLKEGLILKKLYYPAIANGTVGNGGNLNAINTDYVPVEPGEIAKCVITKPLQANGNYYSYINCTYNSNKQTVIHNSTDSLENEVNIIGTDVRYIRFAVIERENASTIDPVRYTNFNVGEVAVAVLTAKNGLAHTYNGNDLYFELGTRSNGNKMGSTNRIRSDIYAMGKGSMVSVEGDYQIGINGYDADGNFVYDYGSWTKKVTIPDDYYISILMRKSNNATIAESEIDGITENVTIIQIPSLLETKYNTVPANVIGLNDAKKAEASVIKLKKTSNEAYGECDAKFLFMTDIHKDITRTQRAVKLANAWGDGYITTVLNGGDTVELTITEGLDWYYNLVNTLQMPILNTVGNHDAWETLGGNLAEATTVYNKIIAPIAQQGAIVQPDNASANGYNYYYKDYRNTLRLIVLDCMYWDDTQLTWLETVLSDARTSGLHVIIMTHAAFPWANMETVDCLWSKAGMLDGYSDSGAISDSTRTNIQAAQAVKTFMDAGGKFVCWLTGHQHGDDVHKLPEYGNQFVVTMGSFAQRASTLQKSDIEKNYNYDCLTYIAIDATNEVIKFLRLGADIDMYGVKHNGLSIDYKNNRLIASW